MPQPQPPAPAHLERSKLSGAALGDGGGKGVALLAHLGQPVLGGQVGLPRCARCGARALLLLQEQSLLLLCAQGTGGINRVGS